MKMHALVWSFTSSCKVIQSHDCFCTSYKYSCIIIQSQDYRSYSSTSQVFAIAQATCFYAIFWTVRSHITMANLWSRQSQINIGL